VPSKPRRTASLRDAWHCIAPDAASSPCELCTVGSQTSLGMHAEPHQHGKASDSQRCNSQHLHSQDKTERARAQPRQPPAHRLERALRNPAPHLKPARAAPLQGRVRPAPAAPVAATAFSAATRIGGTGKALGLHQRQQRPQRRIAVLRSASIRSCNQHTHTHERQERMSVRHACLCWRYTGCPHAKESAQMRQTWPRPPRPSAFTCQRMRRQP